MEKQPVDELFARTLGDMEIQPSDRVFALLEARQKEKRLSVNWGYWAAAACLVLTGAFMWWTLGATVFTPSGRLAIAKTKLPVERGTRKAEEGLAYSAQNQLSSAGNPSMNRPKESPIAINRKPVSTVRRQKVNTQLLADTQQKNLNVQVVNENESIEPTSTTGFTLPAVKELPQESSLRASERTLIVTIEAPITADQSAMAEASPNEGATAHKGGLLVLLQKVKKVKKGENLALGVSKTQHHGFGKLYDEVKESIKNNSIN